jgi:hypothetical protein
MFYAIFKQFDKTTSVQLTESIELSKLVLRDTLGINTYNAMVVFGQVKWDMNSKVVNVSLPYEMWDDEQKQKEAMSQMNHDQVMLEKETN